MLTKWLSQNLQQPLTQSVWWGGLDYEFVALDYTQWRNFTGVIKRAVIACENSGHDISRDFAEVSKIVEAGVTNKPVKDYELTRYACYLIVQNGDPRKEVIALGQTYFAIQTYRIVWWLRCEHPIADLAVLELKLDKYRTEFEQRCFPYDHINDKQECVSRDAEITVIGFPHGLGIQGKFSPLTFRSYASSSFLTLQRADRPINSVFLFGESKCWRI